MTNNNFPPTQGSVPHAQKLPPNEQAIIDTIPTPLLRNLATKIVRIKLRLQFTGWLQYMLPVPVMLVLFLIATLVRLFGFMQLANSFAFVGILLLAVFIFDLVTNRTG